MMLKAYKRYALSTMPVYYLYIFTPIVISSLSFIKIKMQNRMPVKFSRLLNIIVIIFFVIAVKLFYHTLGFMHFISTYIFTAFVFYLDLCSLAYDIFIRKSEDNK